MLASRAAAAVTTVVCVYLALSCDARLRHGHDGGADRVSGGVATAGVRASSVVSGEVGPRRRLEHGATAESTATRVETRTATTELP